MREAQSNFVFVVAVTKVWGLPGLLVFGVYLRRWV